MAQHIMHDQLVGLEKIVVTQIACHNVIKVVQRQLPKYQNILFVSIFTRFPKHLLGANENVLLVLDRLN